MHIKEITLGCIFAIIFVSTGLSSAFSEYGMDIQTANYKILHQHPQLKKCTETYLFQNEYVGCRVSIKTGKCQGLLPSWEVQGIQEGYAYALKVSVQTTFQPPLKVEQNKHSWEIPVTLKAGVQIDTFLSIPTWPDDVRQWILGVMLCQANPAIDFTFSQRSRVEMRVYKTKIDLEEYDGTSWADAIDSSDVQFISEKIFKISLLLENNSLVMLAEGKKVGTLKLKTDFAAWRHIYISTLDGIKHPGYVHKIRYTKNAAEI